MLGICECRDVVAHGLLEYSSGDTLDYVEPCLPRASVSVENLLSPKAVEAWNLLKPET